ncbi:DNA repair protein RecN [Lentilactobacillus senioris]|uniref:DNA repair protein RecN n=1 Tax=Lentilactobacillus senioris TaxID=931534 RepID=UPI002282BF68|nr:DNA repair protein RecN [Lentilactobacillus senioris]MCY9806904.1 DNA repair protein RecN [Lentilactobacillus senioris]
MLLELAIKDFAIIEHLDIQFQEGMTVLTGETGAGKSIIIDAVSLLAGSRASHDLVRSGAKKAIIQGRFAFPEDSPTYQLLDDYGIEYDDGTIIIEREIFATGRTSARINGILVNLGTLKKIGSTIVDIQGQNDQQELMNPDKHIHLLDEVAGIQLKKVLVTYQEKFAKYRDLTKLIKEKAQNEKEWAQRVDMLQFQYDEISRANLVVGEEEELIATRDRLNNFQKIHDALASAFMNINGDDDNSPLDFIGTAMSSLQDISDLDPAFQKIYEAISGAYYGLQDTSSEISEQLSSQEFDQEELEEVEQRLNTIFQLKRKYGDNIEQILNYETKIKSELTKMQGDQGDGDALEQQRQQLTTELEQLATKLTSLRLKAAKSLEKAVHHQLMDLFMEKAVFEVRITPSKELTEIGRDQVEFYIQTNPGEAVLPLIKSASGGELSRIMLALKTMFAKAAGVTSIIFDEVDTGVSGRVAQAIGNKIFTISTKSQVLCITHLPQVAAMSDHHYFISKQTVNERTQTSVLELNEAQRVEEIARMFAGTEITKLTEEHANELIDLAVREKHEIIATAK